MGSRSIQRPIAKHRVSESRVVLIRHVAGAFEQQGWKNEGDTALELVEIYLRKGGALVAADLRVIPSAFYAQNATTKKQVLAVTNQALHG